MTVTLAAPNAPADGYPDGFPDGWAVNISRATGGSGTLTVSATSATIVYPASDSMGAATASGAITGRFESVTLRLDKTAGRWYVVNRNMSAVSDP